MTLDKTAGEFRDVGFLLFASELFRVAARRFDLAGLSARCARSTDSAEQCEALCEGASTPMTGVRPQAAALTSR